MSNLPEDDDPTLIRPSRTTERNDLGRADSQALGIGTRVREFEIIRQIGEGGFSIVYLAWDLSLQRQVALKEYIPLSMASRRGDTEVTIRSERHREAFLAGLKSFVNEARLLAHFEHPSLVKVLQYWEANGTAYMAMPFYEGPTLKASLKAMASPPSEAWLRSLLAPLLDALQTIHNNNIYHRDIAPDNILLLGSNARPLLLDFGAARRVINEATSALTVILKPGYAPIEQYDESSAMKQGPWTDVYALCAVLYFAIAGRPPPVAVSRILKDDLVPLTSQAKGRYSIAFLEAIDAGLAVLPDDRTPDVTALGAGLFGSSERPPVGTEIHHVHGNRWKWIRAKLPVWGGGLVALTSVAFASWLALERSSESVMSPGSAASSSSPDVVPTSGMASTPGSPRIADPPLPESSTREAVVPVPPIRPQDIHLWTSAARKGRDFSIRGMFDDIVTLSDPGISVDAAAIKERVIIGKDEFQLRVKTNRMGFLYVLYIGTDSSDSMLLVFPNKVDTHNRILPNQELIIPEKAVLKASGPAGDDHFLVIVSLVERAFYLRPTGDRQSVVSAVDVAAPGKGAEPPAQGGSASFGSLRCEYAKACPNEFGATVVRIAEVEGVK